MKNSDYWKIRFVQLEEAQNRKGAAAYHEIEEQYRIAQQELEGKIRAWYQRFANNNGISMAEARKMLFGSDLKELKWDVQEYIRRGKENAINQKWMKELENASARFHISRLEALKLQTQQSLEFMFGNQLDCIDSTMKRIYLDGYYHTAYELQKGFHIGFDIAGIDQSQVEKVICKPWAVDGKNFSERIWGNKEKLIAEVHKNLTQNILLGQDPQKAIDAIAKKMKTSKYNAGRLVMTEEAYFSSVAQKDCFQELDVEQYKILATLDSHTSTICQNMDGKVFSMKDFESGVTAPPFHVYCRSTTIPYFEDNFGQIGERVARDEGGKTYYVPAEMTYLEWEEKFINFNQDFDVFKKIKKITEKLLDHKPISVFDIKSTYRKEIVKVIDNAPEEIRVFLKKYKKEIVFINERTNLGSRESDMGIRVNLKKDSVDPRGKWCGTFHEIGHRVDRLSGRLSADPNFEKALKEDFEDLVKAYQKQYNINRIVAYKEISEAIVGSKYHSVSDLFGGISDNKCVGTYSHEDPEYWKKPGRLGGEAFAHFFEVVCRNDVEGIEILKQVFPSAFAMFEDMLGVLK